jgi:hypothetical protein
MVNRAVIAALAVGVVLAAGAPAGAGTTWTQVPSPNVPGSNELLGAGASDAIHVWAVGRVVSDSSWQSLVLRWNGTAWASVAHPHFANNHMLLDVDATPAGIAYAVGNRWGASEGVRTVVERWDGTRWRVERTPNPDADGLNYLNGVRAVPSGGGSVWAVGSFSRPSGSYGELTLAMRRTGGTWRTVPSPNVTSDNHLEAVDATGPNDAWSVGWGNTSPFGGVALAIVQRWDGASWRNVSLPDPTQIMLFGVEAVATNDVWAVGHTDVGGPHWVPLVLHWNGSTWSEASIPIPEFGGQLRDVVALSPTNVYAVGFAGEGTFAETLVLHWDGTSWTRESTPSPEIGPKLFGAAAVGQSTVWAAGHRYDQDLFANRTLTLRSTNA